MLKEYTKHWRQARCSGSGVGDAESKERVDVMLVVLKRLEVRNALAVHTAQGSLFLRD
jgi:hypothetical protein